MILKKKQDSGKTKLLSLKYWGDRIVVQVLCFSTFLIHEQRPLIHTDILLSLLWLASNLQRSQIDKLQKGLITENILHF